MAFVRSTLLLFLSLVVGLASVAPAAADTVITQREFVVASTPDETGCFDVYVQAGRYDATSAYLTYIVWDTCTQSSAAFGTGRIPNAAFVLSAQSLASPNASARLIVTVTGLAGFYSEGLTGSIDLTFLKTGGYFRSFVGTERLDDAGFSVLTRGSWYETAAAFSGTIFGFAVADQNGRIGSSQSRATDIAWK